MHVLLTFLRVKFRQKPGLGVWLQSEALTRRERSLQDRQRGGKGREREEVRRERGKVGRGGGGWRRTDVCITCGNVG